MYVALKYSSRFNKLETLGEKGVHARSALAQANEKHATEVMGLTLSVELTILITSFTRFLLPNI